MERLYSGLADCYRQTKQTRDQIKATKEQYKYAPDKHILLYNLAFLSDKIGDTKATEHYLQAFLRTKYQTKMQYYSSRMMTKKNPHPT